MSIYVEKIGLLDSLKYITFTETEVRRDYCCCSLFSEVGKILPNKDVGINISVATATLKTFGAIIDDNSMLRLSILCFAIEAVLCSVFIGSL